MKKGSIVITTILFLVLVTVIASVSATIDTQTTRGKITNEFLTTDSIIVKSGSNLCNGVFDSVALYIVNKDSGDALVDIRGEPNIINLTSSYALPRNIIVLENPEVGDYEAIIDCDQNGVYHPLEDKKSFKVTLKAGSGIYLAGESINDFEWSYDVEEPDLVKPMLQLKFQSIGEDIDVRNITLKANGLGNDRSLESILIINDVNGNGLIEEDEEVLGMVTPAYSSNNGAVLVPVDLRIVEGIDYYVILAYVLDSTVSTGEYYFVVRNVYGRGVLSERTIAFSGDDVASARMNVVESNSCLGSINLGFEPSVVVGNMTIDVLVQNMSGCSGITAEVRSRGCDVPGLFTIGTCELGDDSCIVEHYARESIVVYGCVDKNNDGDYNDLGESTNRELIVYPESVLNDGDGTVEENIDDLEVVDVNEDENNPETDLTEIDVLDESNLEGFDKITGSSIILGEGMDSFGAALVVFELTLLLILFVLIMILFKLRSPGSDVDDEDDYGDDIKVELEDSDDERTVKKKK